METIRTAVDALIGDTPLLELTRIEADCALRARLLAKLEFLNPTGSVKDRVATRLLDDAERRGQLHPGAAVIEPTSGNTGIALAAAAAARGYQAVIVMPETMSIERRRLMQAYGAELVLTDGAKGMAGAIETAEQISRERPGSFIAGQFVNPVNPQVHFETTGPELWADADGRIDIFVACVGTGGTITGVGRYLKSKKPAVHIVAVEPAGSPVLSGGQPGPHAIEGIGAGFVPAVLDTSIYNEVLPVTDEQAFAAGRLLSRTEGLLAGISSGAALHAAITVALRDISAGKTVAVLLPDSGSRYLSTAMFSE